MEKDWLLNFNIQKCKVIKFGKVQYEYNYVMTDKDNNREHLKNDVSEKDLGIEFQSNLSFDEHINRTVNKVNRIVGLIKRKFSFLNKEVFLTLYKALVRSHLDYGNLIYFPTTKKNKQIIENVQRRSTRIVKELKGLSYDERLKELKLTTLEYRRNRYDVIQTFKILKQKDDIDPKVFFKLNENDLRGHNLKLEKPRANKSIRANSFGHRIIQHWNSLPAEIIEANTVETFKSRLGKHWINRRYELKDIY